MAFGIWLRFGHCGAMRKALFAVALAAVLLAAPRAEAQEKPLAINAIVSVAGADTTNATTAAPFRIPIGAKLTIWCNAAAYVITSSRTAATATGTALPVAASTLFPTNSGGTVDQSATVAAGGAIVRVFGTAAVTCYVFTRSGTE